ncbi:MAG: ABC transporter substrate-binding protein [Candidatus Limnocylindrales bacterium]
MRLKVFALVAMVALIAGACGSSGATSAPTQAATAAPTGATTAAPSAASQGTGTATLRVARLSDSYNFFHPVEAQTGNQFQWWSCIFNTLVVVAADSKTILPGIADSWEASADATTFTFKLHPGVKWHDGTPFTSKDVVFTATWFAQNADAYKGFQPVWGQIKGAKEAKGTTNAVSGIEAPDENTVKITLAAPNSEFLVQSTDVGNMLMPEHLLKDATAADIEKIPFTLGTPGKTIGTGPYTLTAFTPDQSVELTANPDYFKGAPKIPKIVFKLYPDVTLAIAQLESGDLDLAFRVVSGEFERLSKVPTLNVISAPNPGIVRIVFDTTNPNLSDKRVRQAFYYAINRQAIVDSYFKGRAKVLINPPGFKEYDDLNHYAFDVAKAKELLLAAKYDASKPFRLLYNQGSADMPTIMPLIAADLEAAGIKVELMPTDNAAYLDKYNTRGAWEGFMAIGGSEALSPQKSKQYFKPAPDGAKFQSGYVNPKIFELWDAGKSTTDAAKQDEAYHELAKILNDDLPQINLYSDNLVMVSSKKLGGGFDIHLNERESFMDVETWTFAP